MTPPADRMKRPLLYQGRPLILPHRLLVLRQGGRPVIIDGGPVLIGEQRAARPAWRLILALAQDPAVLSMRFRRPEVRAALKELAQEVGDDADLERHVRETIFPTAIACALTAKLTPVKLARRTKITDRHGRVRSVVAYEKVTDRDGRVRLKSRFDWMTKEHGHPVPPRELPREWFWRWFRLTARKHAEEALLGLPRARKVAKEAGPGVRRQWDAVLVKDPLSPEDRKMLRLLREDASHAEVAQALGISPSAARKRADRLAKRSARRS